MNNVEGDNSLSQDIKGVALGTLIAISLFVLIFLILNYFNILSLSELYPGQFGFLPHKSSQIPAKGRALHPEEPILMPTSSPTKPASFQTKTREILAKLLLKRAGANLIHLEGG